ncbi:hypothetical protein Dsin_008827 [Dipteronia sinensis]|uniref:Exo_endo_phos domain-containing protein n=1 Tax=Dipteronia sinensis TaxID=43782 RepID=A0AAE0AQN8_9ROSI|nr:hypothetical protein Dsin_008827 [Dipteronia sinensis]
MGFYGHPVAAKRYHSWTLLKRLKDISDLPWLCVGDFNEILYGFEKQGGLNRPKALMDGFRECVDVCGLEDLGFLGPAFSWSNKRSVGHIQEIIDRGFSCLQ